MSALVIVAVVVVIVVALVSFYKKEKLDGMKRKGETGTSVGDIFGCFAYLIIHFKSFFTYSPVRA